MLLSIDRSVLSKLLGRIIGVVKGKSPLPLLSCVLLNAATDSLTLAATDLEIAIKTIFQAGVSVEKSGIAAVSALKLKSVIDSMSTEKVSLRMLENARLEISAEDSLFKLSCEAHDDFPAIDKLFSGGGDPFQFHADDLQSFICACHHAVGNDITKYNLCGLYFGEENGNLMACATDGHRLSLAGKKIEGVQMPGVIVPRKGLEELRKLPSDSLEVSIGTNNLSIIQGDSFFSVRLIDGIFPEYRRVVPTDYTSHVICSGARFAEAVNRVKLLSDTNGITVDFQDGAVFFRAKNECGDEAVDSIKAELKGDTATINLNARYLLEAIGSLGDGDIVIKHRGEISPVLILPVNFGKWDERLEIIMPFRV